ncbi:hypothetical protein [Roseibium litorale]|uniref:Uncharacterized protein n=1 Tax=Roseibium litorale TaxID=2803841 RepID=A0ABR9CSU5_9HYPH|nr:hypothetical protein [Roseibium litorale]MBD8893956.1 hypothetical protein [Roseibium litorale]
MRGGSFSHSVTRVTLSSPVIAYHFSQRGGPAHRGSRPTNTWEKTMTKTLKSLTRSAAFALTAGAMLFGATTLPASAGPGMGNSLGECYNNWIGWCNEKTSGYPNDCYTKSLKMCDQKHKQRSSAIPPAQLEAMKSTSLRKAKRVEAAVTPASTAAR